VGKLEKERRKKMIILVAQIYRSKRGSMFKLSGTIFGCVILEEFYNVKIYLKQLGASHDNLSKV
jgi:hypothetical protein